MAEEEDEVESLQKSIPVGIKGMVREDIHLRISETINHFNLYWKSWFRGTNFLPSFFNFMESWTGLYMATFPFLKASGKEEIDKFFKNEVLEGKLRGNIENFRTGELPRSFFKEINKKFWKFIELLRNSNIYNITVKAWKAGEEWRG